MSKIEKGLTHIYTGDGKGKTTAAFGLALRAAGNGMRVVIVQFLKGGQNGEVDAIVSLPEITLLRNSREFGFYPSLAPDERDELITEHNEMLQEAFTLIQNGACDMLVLDEIMAAYNLAAIDRGAVDTLFSMKPETVELVLTGRDAPQHMLDKADYVSEIRKIKHPFDEGIQARKGIEY